MDIKYMRGCLCLAVINSNKSVDQVIVICVYR